MPHTNYFVWCLYRGLNCRQTHWITIFCNVIIYETWKKVSKKVNCIGGMYILDSWNIFRMSTVSPKTVLNWLNWCHTCITVFKYTYQNIKMIFKNITHCNMLMCSALICALMLDSSSLYMLDSKVRWSLKSPMVFTKVQSYRVDTDVRVRW